MKFEFYGKSNLRLHQIYFCSKGTLYPPIRAITIMASQLKVRDLPDHHVGLSNRVDTNYIELLWNACTPVTSVGVI